MMGTPKFAVKILEMLHQKHEVLLVVTQPDKPYGRNKILMKSSVKEKAELLNLEVFQPVNLKTDYQKIIDLKPDLIVTAAYGQMLPKDLLDKIQAINVHGSLLPKYRGGAPIQYALFNGDLITGVTIMYMAFKMDSGDIIKQESILIDDNDNFESLSYKLSILGAKLLDEVLIDMNNHVINRYPQDEKLVSFAYTLKREDEMIDFNQSANQIHNKIRGLSPDIGASASIHHQLIKFYKSKISDIIDDKAIPGQIVDLSKKLLIQTKDYLLEILEIQVPGKKKMLTKDFLNGQKLFKINDIFNGKE
jgi:methionyl-tRNA formyltransferase